MKQELDKCLCEGRHPIPQAVDGAIFSNTINPLDVDGLEKKAEQELQGCCKLNLYVTGLTVALVAVLNVCYKNRIDVVLWHYDRASGDYYPQNVRQ